MIGRMLRGRAVRATPYGRMLDLAWLVLTRLREDVPAHERTRLAEIVRTNARNPRGITPQDRADLRRILRHVDLKRIGRDAALRQSPFGRSGYRRH
jgi:hypothetical protein